MSKQAVWDAMSEKDLQSAVLEQMKWMGWLVYHTHDSRRSQPGFPDVVAVRGSRHMFVEFKREKGKIRTEQHQWLNQLADAHGEVYLVRPSTEEAFIENVNVVGSNLETHWRNVKEDMIVIETPYIYEGMLTGASPPDGWPDDYNGPQAAGNNDVV